MAVPVNIDDFRENQGNFNDDVLISIVNADSRELNDQLEDINKFRSYFNGEQDLVFVTNEFRDAFGDIFSTLRANWCEVVVSAVAERMRLRSIVIGEDESLSKIIWDEIRRNDLTYMQMELYPGALIDRRSAVIVWPKQNDNGDIVGVSLDPNPARNVLVTYDADDSRRAIRAIKRWVTPGGEERLTLYMPDYIYKWKQTSSSGQIRTINPSDYDSFGQSWERRIVEGEPWPLPNPFGEVPVVEFHGRFYRSELDDIIPLQDSLNKIITNMMVTSEYASFRQPYIVTSNEEPEGGWRNSPGNVWHIMPEVDIDGRPLPTQVGSLDVSDPSTYIRIAEFFLQEIAAQSRTPAHYFYLSSRQGGRGDAPSGESLRVAETGLIKKVETYQELWEGSWNRVVNLMVRALSNFDSVDPVVIDSHWKHPMAHYKFMLLEEARKMVQELGLPSEIAWRHAGLSEEEVNLAIELGSIDTDSDIEANSDAEPV